MPSGRRVEIACKGRRCTVCGEVWAGDQRIRLLSNLIDVFRGRVAMLTITAPGADVLPWVHGQVVRDVAEAWNRAAPAQWSQMHRRARIALARAGLPVPRLLGYVWAYQRRGVLHLHAVLADESVADRLANARYVQLLKSGLADEWGFGFVSLERGKGWGPKGLASYLAKYVCKEGADGRPELAHTVAHPDVPPRPVYISRDLTGLSRVTMRNLRLRRYYWRGRVGLPVGGPQSCTHVERLWSWGYRVDGAGTSRRTNAP
jgi:hypothetical protein